MRAENREISHLNKNMTEMMVQMEAIMEMMQRNTTIDATTNPPADPLNFKMIL